MNLPIKLYSSSDHYRASEIGIGESDETTFSNFFKNKPGKPNIGFTSEKSFGETVAEQFIERGILKGGMTLLEVGGGDGDFANDFLGYAISNGIKCKYSMLDLNPGLLAKQKEKTGRHSSFTDLEFILADASIGLPPIPEGIDLAMSIEMIADLPVIKNLPSYAVRNYPNLGTHEFNEDEIRLLETAVNLIRNYDLSIPEDDVFHLNYGAIQSIFGLYKLLKPGGSAFITEYSSEVERTPYWEDVPFLSLPVARMRFPEEARFDGHSEFSVKFSHLEAVARKLGFKVKNGPLHEFVGLRPYEFLEAKGIMFEPGLLGFRYLLLTKSR